MASASTPQSPAPAPAAGEAACAAAPPAECDVLVVGAGPAGSACAQLLAREGWRVVLVDQQTFPRDKVCGDGLIPDAHRALERLGVHAEVMDAAQAATHVGCVGPMGGRIEVPGRLAVVPRRVLDDILKRAAERAGARFHAPWRFESLLLDGDRVTGAVLQRPPSGGAAAMITEVRARWTILATGAQPRALIAAEMCDRQTPTGVALRGYIRHPGLGRRHALDVIWNRKMRQGYGWMFPLPDGVWNIGVGVAQSHRQLASGKGRMADVNLREMFDAFTRVYAPAGELVRGGEWVAPLKGAPLRCSLEGARYGRPGLMVTGEAAGSTYAFTGEGIGKAMETGIMAAEAMLAAQAAGEPEGRARERYEAELATLKPRYDLYARASRVNAHPWLADLLIWRASRSPHILRRMAGVLEETTNPGGLVSARGIAKLFLPAG